MDTEPATAAVSYKAASVQIGDHTIWSDVNLQVGQGEFVAILGPNGAGKSTLLKTMLGLQELSTGSVSIFGETIAKARRNIGYLPQRRTFDSSLPIRGVDIVRLGFDGTRWGTPLPGISRLLNPQREREARRRVDEVIELVGATSYAHRLVGATSGGEQQRLLIAQALVRNPRMLLLDEPLDSLDIPNQHAIASLVEQICKSLNITVMMVAHDVNPILSYLDRVVYVANGKALTGAPREIIQSETLSELYGSPIEVLHASDGRLVVVGAPDAVTTHAPS